MTPELEPYSRRAFRQISLVIAAVFLLGALAIGARCLFFNASKDTQRVEESCDTLAGESADACFRNRALSSPPGDFAALMSCTAIRRADRRVACAREVIARAGGDVSFCDPLTDQRAAGLCRASFAADTDRGPVDLASCEKREGTDERCVQEIVGLVLRESAGRAELTCHNEKTAESRRVCYSALGFEMGRSDPAAAQTVCLIQDVPGDRHACLAGFGKALSATRTPGEAKDWCVRFDPGDAEACRAGLDHEIGLETGGK